MLTNALVLPELILAFISMCGNTLTLLDALAPKPVNAIY